ncbi:MAG TPA: ABC transporter permease subunit, partial [Clostridia bacterium]|nr:ABC transporter permease subunit [Clostridia bacterium]
MQTVQTRYSRRAIVSDFRRHSMLYALFLPVLAYFVVFHYAPMYGVVIAFQRFNIRFGVFGSPWIGFENFRKFFGSYYFGRIVGNTFRLSFLDLLFAFPANILFALLLNEIGKPWFKRGVQTLTYLPYFISSVVAAGIIIDFTSSEGIVAKFVGLFTGQVINLMAHKEQFSAIYVGSNIWQGIGFGSIIYLAAISSVNPELYEAAIVDGAGRIRQTIHVTLPGILPTIVIMLILRIGNMLSIGYEKMLLLQNASNLEASEIISTFVYRKGLIEASYG